MDVTKKLVQRKKVAIEEDEKRWVIFKYERLPNFCYNCGLLSHNLRDCPASLHLTKPVDPKEYQYGPWLRGEIIKRSLRETPKMSNKEPPENPMNSDKGDRSCTTEETLTLRGTMVVGREPRSTTDHLGKSIIREETKKKKKIIGGGEHGELA